MALGSCFPDAVVEGGWREGRARCPTAPSRRMAVQSCLGVVKGRDCGFLALWRVHAAVLRGSPGLRGSGGVDNNGIGGGFRVVPVGLSILPETGLAIAVSYDGTGLCEGPEDGVWRKRGSWETRTSTNFKRWWWYERKGCAALSVFIHQEAGSLKTNWPINGGRVKKCMEARNRKFGMFWVPEDGRSGEFTKPQVTLSNTKRLVTISIKFKAFQSPILTLKPSLKHAAEIRKSAKTIRNPGQVPKSAARNEVWIGSLNIEDDGGKTSKASCSAS
ncbi:hypothetical protein EDB89DRAFT_1914338 [Lactarius sanguifluus]|nr:hypothetical protein EDB89DRAFT_1914338 [Lactarius sanguifluus]